MTGAELGESHLSAMRAKWSDEHNRPGGTIARDDVLVLLDEIDRLHCATHTERAGQDVIADDEIEASAAEVQEALRFLRAHKCQCCGQFRTNCVCWGSWGTSGSSHCTPQSHGRDRYGR